MKIDLPYGHKSQSITLPQTARVVVLESATGTAPDAPEKLITQALAEPIGLSSLRDYVQEAEKVVIVVSDMTRPCPSATLLPPLLDALNDAGVADEQTIIVCAIGLHRHQTESERRALVGEEVWKRVPVEDSDPLDVVSLGTTAAGTPVEITRRVAEADAVIAVGNIEYHYFAGYSGGLKAIVPGCASERTVSPNHSMMTRPEAVAAHLEGNPVRMDLEEAAGFTNTGFILNAVLDADQRIVAVVAGDPVAAHRAGCGILDQRNQAHLSSRASIVIASPGGYPKDINLYQAQKGLDNAALAVTEGGMLILVAECSDGVGHDVFERWMREAPNPAACLERLERGFVLGGHKAAAIARVAMHVYQIALVSSLPPEDVRAMGLEPYETAQAAVDQALACYGPDASVVVMPHAASVLPIMKEPPTQEGNRND